MIFGKRIKLNVGLLPCPFCGTRVTARELSDVLLYGARIFYRIACSKCGASHPRTTRLKSAIMRWNGRTS